MTCGGSTWAATLMFEADVFDYAFKGSLNGPLVSDLVQLSVMS